VAYTANVVPIWEGIREHFRGAAVETDFVLFSNYERQVDALIAGQIDIAWNTNLAWVRTHLCTGGRCKALAMRDTDLTFQTFLVSRAGAGLAGIDSLRGRRLALGSRDSAQAAILPFHWLRELRLDSEVTVIRFDSDVGKHGDTGRSELDAIQAVLDDEVDGAAVGITTWAAIANAGIAPDSLEVFWRSPTYYHCNFSTLDTLEETLQRAWVDRLLEMDWDNPEHRRLMEMEGLKRWVPAQTDGYRTLFDAVQEQKISQRW
jgi:ABC-type phosphate/phosphonate transport system substrate-binding protein